MPITLVNPGNESLAEASAPAPRLQSLKGRKIGLLDISKPGGSFFLDHLEELLRNEYGVAELVRAHKPTFAKNAPSEIIEQLSTMDAVIEALAD